MPFSRHAAADILDHFLGKTEYTFAVNRIYVGFSHTTTVTNDGGVGSPPAGITEPVADGNTNYIRKNIAAAGWDAAIEGTAPNAGLSKNNGAVTWTAAVTAWGGGGAPNMTDIFLTTVASGTAIAATNYLGYKALTVPKPVAASDTASIADEGLQISLA